MDEVTDGILDAAETAETKTSDLDDQNEGAIAVVAEPRPPIYKLHIDCYGAVTDWLSLKELHAFGQTCVRLHKAAGFIFKNTYPAARAHCNENGICIGDVQVNGFCDYIPSLDINTDDLKCFRFVETNSFASVKQIKLHRIYLTNEKIACIKKILEKAETIEVDDCILDGEFYHGILQYCVQMKRLKVAPHNWLDGYFFNDENNINAAIMIGHNNDWLFLVYPKLEHLELRRPAYWCSANRKELSTFLQLNPSIRSFAVAVELFHEEILINMTSKLKVFGIDFFHGVPSRYVDEIVSKLQKTEQFYERLHICAYENCDFLGPINKIEKLYVYRSIFNPISSNTLKELDINCGVPDDIKQIQILQLKTIKDNPNLERVSLFDATHEDTLAFIGSSAKLRKLTILSFAHLDVMILDLPTWNNLRANLPRAKKVTIYVEEKVFLTTKWATQKTDFSLVELKRSESYGTEPNDLTIQ